jgi:hypothetical protein
LRRDPAGGVTATSIFRVIVSLSRTLLWLGRFHKRRTLRQGFIAWSIGAGTAVGSIASGPLMT